MIGLFDFDPADVAAIEALHAQDLLAQGEARAQRARHRRQVRHAKAEAQLASILPAQIEPGDSWHVISHGDIDSLSYLSHLMAGVSYFDYVAISTWCIAKADLDQIEAWIDAGRIDRFELYAGEIFPSQYGDEYAQALGLVERYGARVVIARNHSKVTLAGNDAEGCYLVCESSANVNTNPRIEQTAIHADRGLFDFYREFFSGLRSIDRARARSQS